MPEGKQPGSQSDAKDMLEAVQGVLKEIPVYHDMAQPALREVGAGVASIVKLLFTPLRRWRMNVEAGDVRLAMRLEKKLRETPRERRIEPKPSLALPAILGWHSTEKDEPLLAEMYANLLARAMDAETVRMAHPAYVHVIGQMVPDEALMLKHMIGGIEAPLLDNDVPWDELPQSPLSRRLAESAGVVFPELSEAYIQNLSRLGLIEEDWRVITSDLEAPKEKVLLVVARVNRMLPGYGTSYVRETIGLTAFCTHFAIACLHYKE